MAGSIVPRVCYFCGEGIEPGSPMFQAGLDLSRWPEEPPVSLRAHRGCWEARVLRYRRPWQRMSDEERAQVLEAGAEYLELIAVQMRDESAELRQVLK